MARLSSKQQAREKRVRQFLTNVEEDDMRHMLRSLEGCRVLQRVIQACHFYDDIRVGEPLETARMVGMRSVALGIRRIVRRVAPDGLRSMEEAIEDLRSRSAAVGAGQDDRLAPAMAATESDDDDDEEEGDYP